MSNETKKRIIDAATHLFGTHGLANVRLQQVAAACGISVGNLAYHFRTKDLIVKAVYEQLFQDFSRILSKHLQQRSFLDLEQQLDQYFDFFQQYPFFIADLSEITRDFPELQGKSRPLMQKMYLQIKSRLDFDLRRGALLPSEASINYDTLAHSIWSTIVFWSQQAVLRNVPSQKAFFHETIWKQITPCLTSAGQAEFRKLIQPHITTSKER